jgi:hypothetical protein
VTCVCLLPLPAWLSSGRPVRLSRLTNSCGFDIQNKSLNSSIRSAHAAFPCRQFFLSGETLSHAAKAQTAADCGRSEDPNQANATRPGSGSRSTLRDVTHGTCHHRADSSLRSKQSVRPVCAKARAKMAEPSSVALLPPVVSARPSNVCSSLRSAAAKAETLDTVSFLVRTLPRPIEMRSWRLFLLQ